MLHAASGFRWIALAALLATWLLLTPAVSSPASHGLDPMPRQHNKRSGGGVGRKAAMGERSHWEVRNKTDVELARLLILFITRPRSHLPSAIQPGKNYKMGRMKYKVPS